MAEIAFVSQNKIIITDGWHCSELPCGRLEQYRETLASIRRRTEWKTTGTGAKFMGQDMPLPDENDIYAEVGGLACYGGQLVYGIRLDESGSIYIRSLDKNDNNEALVVSGKEIFPGGMCCLGNKLAVSCGENPSEKHISVYELPSSECREYTDGDSIEENPAFDGESRLYFSTAGYARDDSGSIAAVQHKSIVCLDMRKNSLDEILSDEQYDFLKPIPDGSGGFYVIRQPAGGEKGDNSTLLRDIVMFPVRMIKALGGMLDLFSRAFGGESLKSSGNARSKTRDPRKMVIDGNLINAESNLKEAEKRGEKYPGIMPRSRVLLHIVPNGARQQEIFGGVLDYTLLSDGCMAVSNGRHIILLGKDGKELSAVKADRAVYLTEVKRL